MKNLRQSRNKKTLTKIREVESFLGFPNFYRHFIKNFSHTVKPLNKLKNKKNENGKRNIKRYLKNWKTILLINQYLLYLEKKKNSEQKLVHQNML